MATVVVRVARAVRVSKANVIGVATGDILRVGADKKMYSCRSTEKQTALLSPLLGLAKEGFTRSRKKQHMTKSTKT